MFSTFFIYSPQAGIVVIAVVGISWALTLWAPFALISAEVAQRDAEQRRRKRRRQLRTRIRTAPSVIPASTSTHRQHISEHEAHGPGSADTQTDDAADVASIARNSHESKDSDEEDFDSDEEVVDQAGIILGIHNVAISCPQVLSTLVSSVIFHALQKPRGQPWDDSVGWVLRFGGCAAIGAAWFTRRLAEGVGGKAGS